MEVLADVWNAAWQPGVIIGGVIAVPSIVLWFWRPLRASILEWLRGRFWRAMGSPPGVELIPAGILPKDRHYVLHRGVYYAVLKGSKTWKIEPWCPTCKIPMTVLDDEWKDFSVECPRCRRRGHVRKRPLSNVMVEFIRGQTPQDTNRVGAAGSSMSLDDQD